MLKLNFQPPPVAFFREKYSASHGMQIYREKKSLETGVETKNKRLFLELLHSFHDKNRIYTSLVSNLRSNEQ